jgi:mRNA-degrading endonuclease RelE of RelBE toxin-antitoxin system
MGKLRPFEQRRIIDEIRNQLTTEPSTPSRRRKLLNGVVPPWDQERPVWQLRVGAFRVFYDVDQELGEVIVQSVRKKGSKTTEETL